MKVNVTYNPATRMPRTGGFLNGYGQPISITAPSISSSNTRKPITLVKR